MARLRDVGPVLHSFGTWSFLKRVWQQIGEDNIFVWASALAYSWLFAIFPFFIVLMSIIGHLPMQSRRAAHHTIRQFIADTLPTQAGQAVMDNVKEIVLDQPQHTALLSIGLIVTLWSASGGMAMTMYALDRCYDIKRGRPFYTQRPLAVALTVCVTVMVLLVFTLLPLGAVITDWLVKRGSLGASMAAALSLIRYVVAGVLMFSVLATIYYFGPSIRQKFHLISPGAVFSVAVWVFLAWAFRVYVNHFTSMDKTYGALGGVAILLLFFYIDALVLLIGAEINSEIDFEILGVPPGSIDFTGDAKGQPDSPENPPSTNEMTAD